jgi:hypothetical protein
MLDAPGFPRVVRPADPRGNRTVPTSRQWRQHDRDCADADLLRRAAAWLREHPDRAGYAGLSNDVTAHAAAALLDILAAALPDLDSAVRWQAVEACRVVLGQTMAAPQRRRTHRQ